MRTRWLTNTYDPGRPDARDVISYDIFHETREQAWRDHIDWLRGKIIGRPKASETYTIEQLEKMGMVGVYVEEDDSTSAPLPPTFLAQGT